ncbi:phosphotransferase family protein [Pseudonocardia acidicola]|uniref:Aminoglycoside phosphotransferase family protein n=1 Tax=Pseudonocardia acidicola TaxID=2724939 RepID=A0ABX1S6U5_9PSEU|nr:aminoglycoside phosphotransferase family protein [Pseudonocardia acidicola]NMH96644.1 aminoglycoside phosphotransferase family protein [Pseudonocardia acidicola]
MSAAADEAVRAPWQELLPPGRRFVALPSRHRPVVVAEFERPVLSYVRTSLLAAPPRSGLPSWVYAAARQALRIRPLWRLLPRPASRGPGGAEPAGALAGFVADGDKRLVVLQHSRDPDARCVLLLFTPNEPSPSHAVKIAGDVRAAARIDREAQRLLALQRVHSRHLAGSVPQVLDVLDHGGRPALVTTAQRGVPMLVRYHRRGHTADPEAVRADLAAASRWLLLAQSATLGPAAPLDLAPGTAERLRARLTAAPAADRVLDRLGALRARLGRYAAPTTLVHGDFWPGNLLTDRGEITGVVDWEHSELAGNPVRDIARFALAYSIYLDRHTRPGRPVPGHPRLVAGRPGAGAGYGIDGTGWYPDLVRGFLTAGLTRLGLPAACGRDAVLAEIAALAAEATDPDFARDQLTLFMTLSETTP